MSFFKFWENVVIPIFWFFLIPLAVSLEYPWFWWLPILGLVALGAGAMVVRARDSRHDI